MLILTAADVDTLASMRAAIDAVERAFVALSAGAAEAPVRTPLHVDTPGEVLVMPAAAPAGLGAKLVSVFPENRRRGQPLIHAVVVLIDPADGAPLALLEGRELTAIRTGAASGVATRLLARPEARVLTCFGAGAQAVRQIEAVCAVRPIEQVVICSRTPARAEALAARVLAAGWAARAAVEPDPIVATRAADIICTATTATTPIVPAEAVAPGCHLNGVGSYRADLAELPAALVARARVVVDHAAAARREAGDLIQAVAAGLATDEIFAVELGAVAAGNQPGRRAADEITLFKSVGNAVQDVAVARLIVDEARWRGLGRDIDL